MNIGTTNYSTHPYANLKLSNANASQPKAKENKKKDKSEHKPQSNSITDRFLRQKEDIQKRIQALNEKLSKIDPKQQKDLYKLYNESIKELSAQLDQVDQDMAAAVLEAQQKKLEEEQQKSKKAATKNAPPKSDEEKEEKRQVEETKFLIKTDNTFDDIAASKQTNATLSLQQSREKIDMANDAIRHKEQAQRAAASQSAADNDGVSQVPWVPNDSFINQFNRINAGHFTVDEYKKASFLKELQQASKRTTSAIEDGIVDAHQTTTDYVETLDDLEKAPEKADEKEDTPQEKIEKEQKEKEEKEEDEKQKEDGA